MVMPYAASTMEEPLLLSYASGTVTDADQYVYLSQTGPYNYVRLECDLESENGTHTLDIAVEYYTGANSEWTALLDGAGNAVVFNNYANGETGRRFVEIGPGATGGADADKVLAVGNNFYHDLMVPAEMRLKLTRGGTGVDDVITLVAFWSNR